MIALLNDWIIEPCRASPQMIHAAGIDSPGLAGAFASRIFETFAAFLHVDSEDFGHSGVKGLKTL